MFETNNEYWLTGNPKDLDYKITVERWIGKQTPLLSEAIKLHISGYNFSEISKQIGVSNHTAKEIICEAWTRFEKYYKGV